MKPNIRNTNPLYSFTKKISGILAVLILSACSGNTPITKVIEVTHQVDITREVQVTKVVEVTRIVEVNPTLAPATATPSASPLQPADAQASSYISGNESPTFPEGESGQLSVIPLGLGNSDNVYYVVVRNNTTSSVSSIQVTGVAYTSEGKMLATGGDQGLNPYFVRPGEISFGYVYFSDTKLPSDATYTFEVTGTPSNEPEWFRDLDVSEVNLVEDRLVGLFTNNHNVTVTGPIKVIAYCFDETGSFLYVHRDYTDKDEAQKGEQIPFQISLSNDPCPIYLVMGSGYGR